MSGRQSGLTPVPVGTWSGTRPELGHTWFVHGMLEDEHCWKELLALLDPASAVIPQLPWSARSGSDWGRSAEGHDWLAHFANDESAIPRLMVAHSYGCNALLEYLLLHQVEQPEALVLIAPFYRASRRDIDWDTFHGLAGGLEALLGESIAIQDKRGRYTGWLLNDMAIRVRDRLGVHGWAEFLKLFLRAPDLPLERLRCRVLVVSGQHDSHSIPDTNAVLVRCMPDAQHLFIEGAGHFPHITHAAELAASIVAFVAASTHSLQAPL